MLDRKIYAKEFKQEIIDRIKNEGKSVSVIAADYAIKPKLVYNWLRSNTFKDTNVMELNRLRRENKELLEIVGMLTRDLNRGKKA